ncbi:DUF4192 domain-containing protein [Streptomyces gilvosporeus]|uniref:DUF4192 domain-containing protein n=1 Tax=Streptomyces gilvosporeus TaxID=553510 RepID=A0A1V0TXW5_9ACTN|nr:DUF4192 domain-containing protein [Streptomyces gilvosporeus]ARF57815.1 hypothetical protein B1H19_29700 [Streptomyces gilvosporeus]
MNPHSEPTEPQTSDTSAADPTRASGTPPRGSADPSRASDPAPRASGPSPRPFENSARPFDDSDRAAGPTLPTGSHDPTDSSHRTDRTDPPGSSDSTDSTAPSGSIDPSAVADAPPAEPQVTLRGPAELADALPYLLGFYPDDSIVLVALHGERGRFGGRVRLGIPAETAQWPEVADQLADCLISAADDRGERPAAVLVYLCQEPTSGETGRDVRDRLRPLAQRLRTACGALDVPVLEALCLSNGRFWSYCCPDFRCCPAGGTPLAMPGTSVMAAAAAYAGMQVRGSLKEMEARLTPRGGRRGAEQVRALDAAAAALLPRMLRRGGADAVRRDTVALTETLLRRFRLDPPAGSNRSRDACDDALLTDEEAAALILGLQDRLTRDRAAEWMEGPDAAPALRLWRALARRCAGGYLEHSVAPLTLAGWVCWSTEDGPSARVALGRALSIDPRYSFADLLHRAVNQGLDAEPLRRCLREQRKEHAAASRADTAAPGERAQPQPGPRPKPPRPRTADRPVKPRGGGRPGGRPPEGRGRRRAGRDGDRSRR